LPMQSRSENALSIGTGIRFTWSTGSMMGLFTFIVEKRSDSQPSNMSPSAWAKAIVPSAWG